jgi:hypothetical protein
MVVLMVWMSASGVTALGTEARSNNIGRLAQSGAETNEESVREGDLEVLIEDSRGASRTLYFLRSGTDRVQLLFTTTPPSLRTGTRVRVRGHFDEKGRLVVVSLERLSSQ